MSEADETKGGKKENAHLQGADARDASAGNAEVHDTKWRSAFSDASFAIAIVIAVVMALAATGYALFDAHQKAVAVTATRAKVEAFNQYVDYLNVTAEHFLHGGAKAVEAGGLVESVWSSAINNPNGSWDEDIAPYKAADPNQALSKLMTSNAYNGLCHEMESTECSIDDSFKQLASPPEGCDEAYDTVRDMQKEYKVLCEMVRRPSGTLENYREDFGNAHKELVSSYELLKTQIRDKMDVSA